MFDETSGQPYYVTPDGVSMWTRPEGVVYTFLTATSAEQDPRLMEETIKERPSEMNNANEAEANETQETQERNPDPSAAVEAVGPLRRPREEALAIKSAWAVKAARQMSGR